MHPSQGTAHNPSQGTAQGHQAVEAGADKDLINPLLECTTNIPNGNMILQPHQKQPLSRHGDALQALRPQTVSLTVKPYWWTAASRDWRLTGISKMGGARQRGLQYRPSQAGKWIPQLPWHTTTGICLDRTVAVIMPSSSPEQQQQLSVIRKYALTRSATLRDLLACPRGPHQSTTAAAPTKKKKAATASLLSTLLGLVADCVTSPDGDVASARRSQWNVSWMASEPRSVAHPLHPSPPKGHQRGENGYYRTSIINWTQYFTWAAAGNIMRMCGAAPEAAAMPVTQWLIAMCWNAPKPFTKDACNKSRAWPGHRAAPSVSDIA